MWRIFTLCTFVCAALWVGPLPAGADPSQEISTEQYIYPTVMGEVLRPTEPPGVELTARGRNVRGVYIPVTRLVSWTPRQMIRWVQRVGANAVIIDIKDDKGRVTFSKEIPNATRNPHGIVPRMDKFIEQLKAHDIYTIGRLVCFKDNMYVRDNPDAAIKDRRSGKIWRDRATVTWLDPYSTEAHEYIASIAVAAEAFGFDEIQLDYVRFPVDAGSRNAYFSNRRDNMARFEAIAALLARVDRLISVPLSIDVFGLTALRPGDREGLGQSLEHLAPYLDAISPMLYLANWPKRHWENPTPKKTYALVYGAVQRIRDRLGDAVVVRPLLQAFEYRAANFSVDFIYNQIDAASTAGASGHLFWNQAGYYTKVALAWRRVEMNAELRQKKEAAGDDEGATKAALKRPSKEKTEAPPDLPAKSAAPAEATPVKEVPKTKNGSSAPKPPPEKPKEADESRSSTEGQGHRPPSG